MVFDLVATPNMNRTTVAKAFEKLNELAASGQLNLVDLKNDKLKIPPQRLDGSGPQLSGD